MYTGLNLRVADGVSVSGPQMAGMFLTTGTVAGHVVFDGHLAAAGHLAIAGHLAAASHLTAATSSMTVSGHVATTSNITAAWNVAAVFFLIVYRPASMNFGLGFTDISAAVRNR